MSQIDPSASTDALSDSTSIGTAKQRMAGNIVSNFLLIGLNTCVSIFLAPYLISNLGISAYGMITLANSFPTYIRLASTAITNTVLRYVSLHVAENKLEQANLYYNTAVKTSVFINVLLLIPVILFACLFSKTFNVPLGLETQSNLLVGLVLTSSLVMAVTSTIKVAYPLFHKFYLENLILGFSRLLAITGLLTSFFFFGPRLDFVGGYQFFFAVMGFVGLYFFQLRIQTLLRIRRGLFQKQALKELGGMSLWSLTTEFSTLLYLSAGIAVVNECLGPEITGQFGPVMLINSLLLLLAGSFGNVLVPVFYKLVGQADSQALLTQLVRAMRLLSFMVGLPVTLLCGLAKPIFAIWLGSEFVELWPLLWLVTISMWAGGICYLPVTHVYRGKNYVMVPALVSLAGSISHLTALFVLILYFDMGLISFGLSFIVFYGLLGIIANSWYAGHLLKQSLWKFLLPVLRFMPVMALCLLFGNWLTNGSSEPDWFQLSAMFFAITVCYTAYGFFVALSAEDRQLLIKMCPVPGRRNS